MRTQTWCQQVRQTKGTLMALKTKWEQKNGSENWQKTQLKTNYSLSNKKMKHRKGTLLKEAKTKSKGGMDGDVNSSW